MKKILLGLFLGILLQKVAVSAHSYSWFYYEKQCRDISTHIEYLQCIEDKQGILHYIGLASGTITPYFGRGHVWRY